MYLLCPRRRIADEHFDSQNLNRQILQENGLGILMIFGILPLENEPEAKDRRYEGQAMKEIDSIKERYERRKSLPRNLYSLFNPGNIFILQQRERDILRLLDKYGMNPLADRRILDVGCGSGGELRRFIEFGASPGNLFGIDLLPDRIARAKELNPLIDLRRGNAEELPYEDENFDIVMQFTIFTSILDDTMKMNIAQEMLRVLRPDGIILWYDFYISKPTNPDVKGIGKQEIKKLFPNCSYHFKRVTLVPPLSRIIAPYSLLLCYLLGMIPFLCTHYLLVICKDMIDKERQEE
jgi:SAM-dependent methyltransferase